MKLIAPTSVVLGVNVLTVVIVVTAVVAPYSSYAYGGYHPGNSSRLFTTSTTTSLTTLTTSSIASRTQAETSSTATAPAVEVTTTAGGGTTSTASSTTTATTSSSTSTSTTTSTPTTSTTSTSSTTTSTSSHPPPTYYTTFSESGLPTGTSWEVVYDGATGSALAPDSISFATRSGSYSFSVGSVSGFTVSPSSGSAASGSLVPVTFAQIVTTTTTTTTRTSSQTSTTATSSTTSTSTTTSTTTSTSSTTTTTTSSGCQVSIQLPSGDYQTGATVSATVSASCPGSTKWRIYAQNYLVDSGTTHSNASSSTVLFSIRAGSPPLVNGSYSVTARFDNGHGVRETSSSSFTVTGGGSPGALVGPSSLVVIVLLTGAWKGMSRRSSE